MTDKLAKMLVEINATPLQRHMAFILLKVNGIENAIGYIEVLEGKDDRREIKRTTK